MPERGSPSANLVAERCNREGPGWPGRQLRVTGGSASWSKPHSGPLLRFIDWINLHRVSPRVVRWQDIGLALISQRYYRVVDGPNGRARWVRSSFESGHK